MSGLICTCLHPPATRHTTLRRIDSLSRVGWGNGVGDGCFFLVGWFVLAISLDIELATVGRYPPVITLVIEFNFDELGFYFKTQTFAFINNYCYAAISF